MPVNRRIRQFLLWPLLFVAVLLALLRIALAPGAEYALRDWFAQQGVDATVDDISFDMRQGRLELRGLKAGGPANPLLQVDALDVDWTWRALFERRLQVDAIRLEGLFVDIERGPDSRLVIAGIDLGSEAGAEPQAAAQAPAEPVDWQVEIGNLTLEDLKHCYRAPANHFSCGALERLTWNGRIGLDLARLDEAVPPLQVSGNFDLAGVELQDQRSEQALFALERLALDQLRFDGLEGAGFDALRLSGIFVDVARGEDAQLVLAGIDLGSGAASEPAGTDTVAEPLQGSLDLGKIEIEDFRHCYRAPPKLDACGGFEALDWDGRLELDLARLAEAVPPLQANGDFSLAGVELQDNRSEQALFELERLALEKLRLDGLTSVGFDALRLGGIFVDIERGEDAQLVIAGIDLGGDTAPEPANTDTAAEPLQGNLDLGQIEIEDFKHCYRAPPQLDFCGGFGRLDWNGKVGLDLAGLDEAVLPLRADGNFRLDGVELRHTQLDRSLIAFERLALDAIRIDGLDRIEIDTAALDALALLEREDSSERPRVTSLEQLRVERMLLRDMTRVEIGAVEMRGHALTLVKDAQGRFEFEQWLPAPATGDSVEAVETAVVAPVKPEAETAADSGETDFSFAVERFDYATDRGIVYRDRSLEKEFVVSLNPVSLKLENLDSARPDQAGRIDYSAQYAEHGKIELRGSATPFAAKPSFDLSGRIEGLDLRDLSPFTAAATGHRIRSGQLDADLKLLADQGVLDSAVDLTLNQFTLNAISEAEREKLDASLGFPLNASLSLLKDRDNRIQLNIPITGDLENPEFDPSDAIRQALSSAITAAVLNYYTPFGLITLADGLVSLATALRFEPVVFPAGADDIATVDAAELDKIASLMQDRPGVDVTLCPFTNRSDRIELFPETAEIPSDELELDSAQRGRLDQLGEARAAGVKRYLAAKGIDPARLVLCAAEHAENAGRTTTARQDDADTAATSSVADGLAGVEISI